MSGIIWLYYVGTNTCSFQNGKEHIIRIFTPVENILKLSYLLSKNRIFAGLLSCFFFTTGSGFFLITLDKLF